MSAISNVASSVDAMNQVMMMAQNATLEQAKKLVQVQVEQKVGAEAGKGAAVDVSA